jgi:NodT family efflux transporter outer membrane factor (OMF) lipoprotein
VSRRMHAIWRNLLVAIGVTLLGGCIDGGGIKPHSQLVDASTLDAGAALAKDHGTWPNVDWWTHWHDAQLNALVTQALAGQPGLRAAMARVELAQAQAKVAGANTFPQLNAVGDFGRERYPSYATPVPPGGYTVWSNDVGATLSYQLDLWGKNRATLEGAMDVVHASAAELHGVQLALETAVVRAYIELSLQYELQDVDQAILDQASKTRDIVAQRLGAGLGSHLELSQAEAQVAVEASQLEQTNRQIAIMRNQLAALVGQGPGAGASIGRPHLSLDLPVALPASLPAELVGHRPDVVAQRWRVEAASKDIAVAHAAFYPNVDLVAMAGLASTTPFGGFFNFINSDAVGHRVGAAISLPIFEGGRLRGQYGAAFAYNQNVILAMQQVADQVVSLQSLASEQQHVEQAVKEADKAYQLALLGYRNGITEFLNVLATQTTLLRQRQQLAAIQAKRLDAWSLLMQALGGGLESPSSATAPRNGGDGHAS